MPLQWRIQTFEDGGANRDLSDNAVLPKHLALWFAEICKAIQKIQIQRKYFIHYV